MNRTWITLLCVLAVQTVAAAAENLIEPGQWKITTNTLMNGSAMPPQVKARCLTPEQAGDVGKTFGAAIDTVNSTCERTEYEASGRKAEMAPAMQGATGYGCLGRLQLR
jgi:hypothetical protein